jgi:hypothetical protein
MALGRMLKRGLAKAQQAKAGQQPARPAPAVTPASRMSQLAGTMTGKARGRMHRGVK